ncbi:MAG: hypothetical protein MJA32_03100 [Proteobacteria bacterium]|nr:hypothetical protein [Pseudomonadota bacterium]
MKNLLLLLILANVLYFMWGAFAAKDPQPGVVLFEESGRRAAVGRSCVTIGPFEAKDAADSAALEYRMQGLKTATRQGRAQVFVGHSVQIQNVDSRDAARRIVGQLGEHGIGDAYPIGTDENGYAVALGTFGNAENAENVALQAESAGFDVTVAPMMRDAMAHFVDVGLPPGEDVGAIVEQHGEAIVALRDAAVCP